MSAKLALLIDGIVTATKSVLWDRRLDAVLSNTYPRSPATFRIVSRVAGLTEASLRNARLTVITDTPAARATSLIFTERFMAGPLPNQGRTGRTADQSFVAVVNHRHFNPISRTNRASVPRNLFIF